MPLIIFSIMLVTYWILLNSLSDCQKCSHPSLQWSGCWSRSTGRQPSVNPPLSHKSWQWKHRISVVDKWDNFISGFVTLNLTYSTLYECQASQKYSWCPWQISRLNSRDLLPAHGSWWMVYSRLCRALMYCLTLSSSTDCLDFREYSLLFCFLRIIKKGSFHPRLNIIFLQKAWDVDEWVPGFGWVVRSHYKLMLRQLLVSYQETTAPMLRSAPVVRSATLNWFLTRPQTSVPPSSLRGPCSSLLCSSPSEMSALPDSTLTRTRSPPVVWTGLHHWRGRGH